MFQFQELHVGTFKHFLQKSQNIYCGKEPLEFTCDLQKFISLQVESQNKKALTSLSIAYTVYRH